MYGNRCGSGLRSTIYVPPDFKKSPSQLVFGRDMILPINNLANWRFIHQHKQAQIEEDLIRKNCTRTDHNDRVGDQITVRKKDFKYETPFKGPYDIVQTWTNGTVLIQALLITDRLNIRRIKPYNSPEVDLYIHLQRLLTCVYCQHIYI